MTVEKWTLLHIVLINTICSRIHFSMVMHHIVFITQIVSILAEDAWALKRNRYFITLVSLYWGTNMSFGGTWAPTSAMTQAYVWADSWSSPNTISKGWQAGLMHLPQPVHCRWVHTIRLRRHFDEGNGFRFEFIFFQHGPPQAGGFLQDLEVLWVSIGTVANKRISYPGSETIKVTSYER